MNDASYLTPQGLEKLRKELAELTGPARDQLSKRLRSAIQQGDLSENADYISAKEEQGFLEGRIQELEKVLNNVVIIDLSKKDRSTVEIGAEVSIQEGSEPLETYFLVGPKEADPRNGRISHESPIGEALIGHKAGDEIEVATPSGAIKLKIISIK